jgi:hypothetical protein
MTRSSRSGVAMILALFLLAMVGTTAVVVTRAMVEDARRTRATDVDGQLCEVLRAGQVMMIDRLSSISTTAPTRIELPLPAGLSSTRLSAEVVNSGAVTSVSLVATLGERSLRSVVGYRQYGESWQVVTAELVHFKE